MRIKIGDANPVSKDPSAKDNSLLQTPSGRRLRERRRNRFDRRKSVRDGVFVKLSFKRERRSGIDRRRRDPQV
jgi:hypothetical protein